MKKYLRVGLALAFTLVLTLMFFGSTGPSYMDILIASIQPLIF